MRVRFLLAAFLLAVFTAAGVSSPPKTAKAAKSTNIEKGNTGVVTDGTTAQKKIAKLNEQINWFTSLDEAQSKAKTANKPILWIHVLGDIDGIC